MEYLNPEDTYSPLLHRINQVIGYRATHPNDPIPPPLDILTKFSHPPADLIKGSEKVQQKLIEAFDVKKGTSRIPPCPVGQNADSKSRQENSQKGRRLMKLNRFLDWISTLCCLKERRLMKLKHEPNDRKLRWRLVWMIRQRISNA